MTISAPKKYWTDDELLAMPKDGYEREIVNGELIVSPAGLDHGLIIMRIAGPLGTFVLDHELGETFDGQTGCRMESEDLFSPDISFVPSERLQMKRKARTTFFRGGPDLVVEVLSPGDTIRVTKAKIAQYFKNGTRLAWVVHPRTRTIHVYHSPIADKILSITDLLEGEDVVPGFRLPVNRIFK